MKSENPYIPDEQYKTWSEHLPASHPMNNPPILTQLQQAHLPALMWLFDTNRYRAQGRSTLLAYVAIQLAMQGTRVYLNDVSIHLTNKGEHRQQSYFVDLVLRMTRDHFREHIFVYNDAQRTLEYRGRHPR